MDEWCDSLYLFGLRVKTHILIGVLLLARTGPARAHTARLKPIVDRRCARRVRRDVRSRARRSEGEAREPSHPSRASTDREPLWALG